MKTIKAPKRYFTVTASGCMVGHKGEHRITPRIEANDETQARDLLIENNPKVIFSFINISEVIK